MSISLSDIIAGVALLVSAYAAWQTVKFNQRQRSLIESQERLNQRLLQREDLETRERGQADLGVTLIKLGSSSYRLKIWNKGKSAAKNVSIAFPEGNDWFIGSDVESKFPLESLEPQQSVELIAAIAMGSRSKHAIDLRWSDRAHTHNGKTLYATL